MEQQAEETWEQQPEVQVQEEPQEEEQVETSRNTSRTLDIGFFCVRIWKRLVVKWIERNPRSDFDQNTEKKTLDDSNTLVNKFASNRTFSIKLAYED